MNRSYNIGVILAGLLVPATMGAQQISIGETVSVQSELLGEDRSLMIFLPESYSSSSFSYPVLYLLDGEPEFLHTAGIVEFLAGADQIPELIVGVVALPFPAQAQALPGQSLASLVQNFELPVTTISGLCVLSGTFS